MGKRERLDRLLVERGLVATREEGRRRILAGTEPNDCAGKAQHRPPDGTVYRAQGTKPLVQE